MNAKADAMMRILIFFVRKKFIQTESNISRLADVEQEKER